MKSISTLVLLLFLATGIQAQSVTNADSLYTAFKKKVEDAKMTFAKPDGAVDVPVMKSTGVYYDYAYRLKDKNIEVRYIVWPLTQGYFDSYNRRQKKPGDTVLNPNKLHNTIPAILYSKISGGRLAPEQVSLKKYSYGAVSTSFKADEGAMFMGPVDSAFGQGYKYGFFEMIHKDYAGDAYLLFLFENQNAMFETYKDVTANDAVGLALKFK
ncbi:hypothetical protein FO440_13335 [Mucilaginibacter corticis]|uniref:Uncharacterized protein n=1 Tax=Mucilaginibacter corticis TaxID=2597670 RepID=A0A556MLJ6_9SPHI|nr:hypothetical protein [Mucilaginibacter corticis]TSJ40722.1 hypothetical protein FO440_13335 [Mucilaginibacter corticis]